MNGRSMRVLDLGGEPSAMGAHHGSGFGAEIRAYAGDRVDRSSVGTGLSVERVLGLAEDCLPAHEAYAPHLFEEMVSLADAAGISPAEAMILGGFTDFADTVRAHAGAAPVEDDCTAVVVPDRLAGGSGFLAQTWDMHASATGHIIMLRLRPAGRPAAHVFTTVGCLGQIGMNEAGLAVGITNLTASDGRIGVTWPFVVRRALEESTVDAAVAVISEAPLSGGHSYLLFDRAGSGAVVEAMPTRCSVTSLSDVPLVHTNHCLVDETRTVEGARPPELQESSLRRLAHAGEHLSAGPVGVDKLVALTRDDRSICRRPQPPFDYESCGAAIMRPGSGEMWACWGLPSENDYERFDVS